MRNIKYTDSVSFRCLENLRETSFDIDLIHTGKEKCAPLHIYSGVREEYIIHFVLSGSGFYSARGKTWKPKAGEMFLIYPGEEITYGANEHDPWTYAWIGFKGIRAESILKQCGFSGLKLIMSAPAPEKILACITEMMEHRTLTYANDLRRQAGLLYLFSILIDNHAAASPKSGKADLGTNIYVASAVEYIKNMYRHGINVSDIADNIGISRAYLNHAFQKELGLSVQKFLIDYRMHKAANLLASTEVSVKEVALQVGYVDQLTFSKAFKKKFELSPKDYRLHTDAMDRFSEKQ